MFSIESSINSLIWADTCMSRYSFLAKLPLKIASVSLSAKLVITEELITYRGGKASDSSVFGAYGAQSALVHTFGLAFSSFSKSSALSFLTSSFCPRISKVRGPARSAFSSQNRSRTSPVV